MSRLTKRRNATIGSQKGGGSDHARGQVVRNRKHNSRSWTRRDGARSVAFPAGLAGSSEIPMPILSEAKLPDPGGGGGTKKK